MSERIEKIKNHLSEHKVTYFVGVGGVVVGECVDVKVKTDTSCKHCSSSNSPDF